MALADAAIEVAGGAHVVVLTIDHDLSVGSERVAAEVAGWARSRGAAGVIRRVRVERRASGASKGAGIESAARDARYAALDELAAELGLTAILVGHTARDQAETVLMRILRGTGPAGLAAMTDGSGPKRVAAVPIVRPLLAIDRETIDAHVAARALPVWDDPMNLDPAIMRVRIRRDLLPLLRRENPQVDQALLRLAASAAEWLAVIDALALPFAQFPIDCAALAQQPPAVRKRAVALALEQRDVGWETVHLDAIDELIARPPRGEVSLDLPGGRIVRSYDGVGFEHPNDVRTDPAQPPQIPEGCEIRGWRAGDRMRPQRLGGRSRKLSDLFVDAKVPRSSRTQARVIVRSSDGAILWAQHIGIAHDAVVTEEERKKLAAKPA
jgi:tRNA(Ile)-lysidine synthase